MTNKASSGVHYRGGHRHLQMGRMLDIDLISFSEKLAGIYCLVLSTLLQIRRSYFNVKCSL
jgi:hypothetical protein